MNTGHPDKRDIELGRLQMACPVCRKSWLVVVESGSMGHRRECPTCRVQVVLPRVPLVKAIKRTHRILAATLWP